MIKVFRADTDEYICYFGDEVENEEIIDEMKKRGYEEGDYYIKIIG